MIKVCQKCQRVKLNDEAPWSPRPSPQVGSMPKNKLEPVEECDYCDGTIQDGAGVSDRVLPESNSKNEAGGSREKINDKTTSVRVKEHQDVHDNVEKHDTKVQSKPAKIEEQAMLPAAKLDEKLAVVADKHHQALVQCKKLMGQSMLEFCKHLREIKDRELFRFYAQSWYEYLSMPEVGLDDTRARRLIRLINVKDAMEKQLGRDVNFDEISEARLTRDVLPCVQYNEETGEIKNIKTAEVLLDQARTLGHEDWQAEVEKKKPRVGGKKAAEVLIEAPSMVTNAEGTPIGQLVSVSANEENHYLKIRIANENIPDGPLVIKIPVDRADK